MQIQRASSVLKTDYFRTMPREQTLGIYATYTNTTTDARIDASTTDSAHAKTGRFGVGCHYVVKIDGTIEIARHPMSVGLFGPDRYHHTHILVGVVGGLDRDTGKRLFSVNQAQYAALDELYQKLADALNTPLALAEFLTAEDVELAAQERAQARLENELAAQEATTPTQQLHPHQLKE